MAMKAWDKLNLEQKLRRIETAWRMQAEGRPPTEYAPYMSPAMLKSQFNNSIEEPPPGALPQSLFDASEAVRRGYTPPTGPDPPGSWSELPPNMQEGSWSELPPNMQEGSWSELLPQMQEGYMGGAPIPGGYDDQGARVGLDMPGQAYGQPLNAAPMVGPSQSPPMPTGNWGVNGGSPTPRPMVNSPRSGIQMPGVNTAPQIMPQPPSVGAPQNVAQGMPPGYPDPTARYSVRNVMASPGTSPMGPAQFPMPDQINMMPQGQRIADSAVGLGRSLPQDLTNQIINQFAGSTAPVPNQTAPDIGVPQGVPNIPSMMAVPQPQPSVSGGMGDLGLGRMPQGIAPPMEISASPSGHRRSLTPGIEYGRMTTDSGRLVRDLGLDRTPQDIASPMNIGANGSQHINPHANTELMDVNTKHLELVDGIIANSKDQQRVQNARQRRSQLTEDRQRMIGMARNTSNKQYYGVGWIPNWLPRRLAGGVLGLVGHGNSFVDPHRPRGDLLPPVKDVGSYEHTMEWYRKNDAARSRKSHEAQDWWDNATRGLN